MKKGYFFMLDAFIAISVLVLSVILIFSFHSQKPYQLQGIFLSDDIMDLLAETKVYEVNDDFVYSLYTNGSTNITNADNTLIEQATVFYMTNRTFLAENFLLAVADNSVPDNFGFELWIYNTTDSFNLTINSGNALQNESEQLVTSKRLILGLLREEFTWGPATAEVRIWQ